MGRTFQQILIASVLALGILTSCNKDKKTVQPSGTNEPAPTGTGSERYVYIACEGNFGTGNASLSMQDVTSLAVYNDVYLNTNGKSVGDVFQSIQRIDDKIFMCINNSDKILVIDAKTREYIGKIDIPKPRYILPINAEKAYVSTMYSNKVYVINPQTRTILGTIDLPAQNPESMAILGSRAYITTWDENSNRVYVVSIVSDEVLDSFRVAGYAPHSVLVDGSGFVWVLSGNIQKGRKAALTKLAPGSADIVDSFLFGDMQDPIKLRMNGAGNELYFIGVDYNGTSGYNGVYKMKVTDTKLPSAPLIPAQKFQYYWGLGIDPLNDDIYVGDPKGFIQKGTVNVYNSKGEQKRTFDVGVGPGYFYFDE